MTDTGYVRLWECRFCHDHLTMPEQEAAEAMQDREQAQILHQVTRDHIRNKHPKVWPLWKSVIEEVKALSVYSKVGVC
jgi:hypothetical protein